MFDRAASLMVARLKHGASSSYSSAQRALRRHRDALNSDMTMEFGKIPDFLRQIELSNPDSTSQMETSSEGIFEWAFLCLGAAKNAFAFCRPMIIADACHIKNNFGGVIMAASAHDGDDHIVPLAIGLFSIENDPPIIYCIPLIKIILND